MKRVSQIVAAAFILCSGSTIWAANLVTVESTTMGINGQDCPIRVRLENDVTVGAFVVPLVIREVTPGAFITEIRLSFEDRLAPGGPFDALMVGQYADPDGTCKPGGFGTQTYNDTQPHPVASPPEGVMFWGVAFFPYRAMPPGADVTGSLVMTVDLTGTPGTFEIDTTCIDPANHLGFYDEYGMQFTPAFVSGTITVTSNTAPVAACSDVTIVADASCEAMASIDNGSFDADGDPLTMIQVPPGPYSLGQTNVKLVVSDPYCRADSCEALVTVIDRTPPEVACAEDTTVIVDPEETGSIVEFTTTATDYCSSVTTECTPPSGSVFPVGTTTVTCIATDGWLNSDTCTFEVIVTKEVCNYRPEDVNCDGVVNVLDVVQVVGVSFRSVPESSPCCDYVR